MFVEISCGDERTDGRDDDREEDPEYLRADLPYEAVVRIAGAEPTHADHRVPAEFALDDCSELCQFYIAIYLCGWVGAYGAGV